MSSGPNTSVDDWFRKVLAHVVVGGAVVVSIRLKQPYREVGPADVMGGPDRDHVCGSPKTAVRRAKNLTLGRLLGRAGLWRNLWK